MWKQNRQQKKRFLLVGIWNTLFGYLLFVSLYGLLQEYLHYATILAIGYLVGITQAYFCYKFLVFKTKGDYLGEYFRFYLVYGLAFMVNLALLPFFVEVLKISPVISQGVIILLTTIVSYIGHKNFSFGYTSGRLEKSEQTRLRDESTCEEMEET